MPPREQLGSDPRDFLRLLRRRGWILLACAVVLPLATYLYSQHLTKTYEASVTVQPGATASDVQLIPGQGVSSSNVGNIAAVAALVQTGQVLKQAAKILGHSPSGDVSASSDVNTGFVQITVKSSDPRLAADSANAYSQALGFARQQRGQEKVDAAIKTLRQNVATEVDPTQRRQLSDQLQQLRAIRSTQAQNVQLIDAATVPKSPISPNPGRNARLALIVALLIGTGLMVLVERWDRRLRKPEDVEELTDVPLLAVVPRDAFPGGRPSPAIAEAFQTLRDSLTYFNVDRELLSLMVVSPLKGEGKTTVATNLAVSLARSGRKVILVDADLRSPQIAERMGIDHEPGLSNVLVGAPVASALREPKSFSGGLRVLPAGRVPPNPSELLGSKRMSTVLAELSQQADVVVIDTAPLLAVSDAYPLLDQVAGIVGIARLHETPRPAVFRLLEVIAKAGGRTLGMVATGRSRTDSYGYGAGYGYGYEQPKAVEPRGAADSANGGPVGHPPVEEPHEPAEAPAKAAEAPAKAAEPPALPADAESSPGRRGFGRLLPGRDR